jgi:hypothetical protein
MQEGERNRIADDQAWTGSGAGRRDEFHKTQKVGGRVTGLGSLYHQSSTIPHQSFHHSV